MNISGVDSQNSMLNLVDLYGTKDADGVSEDSVSSHVGLSSISQSDSLDLSQPAEIYSKLQELAKTDPEKLKEVCAQIAERLRNASENSTGRDSKMLGDLAEKFQSVADGGDISQLKPPEPPSFSGGARGPIDKYTEQQDAQAIQLMGRRETEEDSGSGVGQLLSSILDDLNEALSG